MTPTDFHYGGAIVGPQLAKQLRRLAETLQGSPPTESFPIFYINLKLLKYFR